MTALPAPTELARLEGVIERGLQTFIEVGQALLEIRDGRLYRESHATFEDYCRERWGWSRQHAARLIAGSEVAASLSPMGDIPAPTTERQVRPLTALPREEQPEAWREAVEAAGGVVPTQAQVERAVAVRREPITDDAGGELSDGFSDDVPTRDIDADGPKPVDEWGPEEWAEYDRELDAAAGISGEQPYDESVRFEPPAPSRLAPLMSSATPEWYTPEHIVARVLEVLDAIDLDPCADPLRTITAKRHFTAEDDGLTREWRGRVYMNPPYGAGIGAWVEKLREEHRAGRVTEAIALVPARTDTRWWRELVTAQSFFCLVDGRLRFSGAEVSAPFPNALVYLGMRADRFIRVFREVGMVCRRVSE